ncbi:MAG: family 1 glycosylhydrolase, partial [Thermodesulfobacteriota bacterium]
IKLMKQLGLRAYRFSISWPRIFPQGRGKVNRPGFDFYSRLVDGLLEADIRPFVTLYHWDLPQALQEKGGWDNRDTVYYFRDYVAEVAGRLSDRVSYWVTHNEPWVVAFLGHMLGTHAPGLKNLTTALQVSYNLLLSHGMAVRVLREIGGERTQVGITLNLSPVYPGSRSKSDYDASIRFDGCLNRWFLDPIFKGEYPQDMTIHYEPDLFIFGDVHDPEVISAKIDFLGVNYYARSVIEADPEENFLNLRVRWEPYSEGLYGILTRLKKDYAPAAIYITGNGVDLPDRLNEKGEVNDPRRIEFLGRHLLQVHRAIQEGVNVRGYFVWSLMDDFEFEYGYSKRFGLIYVDFPTQRRFVKKSGFWYRRVIEKNGLERVK